MTRKLACSFVVVFNFSPSLFISEGRFTGKRFFAARAEMLLITLVAVYYYSVMFRPGERASELRRILTEKKTDLCTLG